MKTNQILIGIAGLVVIVGGIFAFNSFQADKADDAMEQEQVADDEAMMEEDMGTGYYLMDGSLVTKSGSLNSVVTETVTLDDGTTVSPKGEVTKPDGTTIQLNEGESIWSDGTVLTGDQGEDAMTEGDDAMMEENN